MTQPHRADDERLVARLKALAHPARLEIVDLLAARGACVCGEIVSVLPLAQATVSQHLKILKEAGLVQGTIDGPRSCYCLDGGALAELRRALDARLGKFERGCCTASRPSAAGAERGRTPGEARHVTTVMPSSDQDHRTGGPEHRSAPNQETTP